MRLYTEREGVGMWRRTLILTGTFLAVFALTVQSSRGADDEIPVDPSGPIIGHTPVTTTVRGVPVEIHATIEAQGGASITSKTVLVKISDVGTPVKYPLTGAGSGGAHNAVIPVSFIKGVTVFWYSINVFDSNGGLSGTPWIRVVIVEPIEAGGNQAEGSVGGGGGSGGGDGTPAGGTGGGSGGSGTVGGGSGSTIETATFVVGGVLLAGGTAVLVDNHGSKNKKAPEPEPEPEPEPPTKKKPKDPVVPPVEEPPCVTTGSEAVTYDNLSLYCQQPFGPITILVCGTCPDATISATSSWGEMDEIQNYNNDVCNPQGPLLSLQQPDDQGGKTFFNPGDETITVFANGVQIDQIVWPPLSDNQCL